MINIDDDRERSKGQHDLSDCITLNYRHRCRGGVYCRRFVSWSCGSDAPAGAAKAIWTHDDEETLGASEHRSGIYYNYVWTVLWRKSHVTRAYQPQFCQ